MLPSSFLWHPKEMREADARFLTRIASVLPFDTRCLRWFPSYLFCSSCRHQIVVLLQRKESCNSLYLYSTSTQNIAQEMSWLIPHKHRAKAIYGMGLEPWAQERLLQHLPQWNDLYSSEKRINNYWDYYEQGVYI